MMFERGCDQDGITCWRHKVSKVIQYTNPYHTGLPPLAPHPNMSHPVQFFPDPDPERATTTTWETYTDEKTKRPYWYNNITKKTQWENPFNAARKPPPPPPQPEVDIPEHLQWTHESSRLRGSYWYNHVTGKSQTDIPDCRRKYR